MGMGGLPNRLKHPLRKTKTKKQKNSLLFGLTEGGVEEAGRNDALTADWGRLGARTKKQHD